MRAVAIAAALLVAAAQAAQPVAFVADVKGSATIEGDGKITFLAELAPGTRLLLGTGAQVSVAYALSGNEFALEGPGEFLVMPAEVRAEKGARPHRRQVTALSDSGLVSRVSRSATASLRMRGLSPTVHAPTPLEYPVDTRVASLQPTLRWREQEGAKPPFAVRIVDADGKEAWKGSAKDNSARPSAKLQASTTYRWSVSAGSQDLGEAGFETASAEAIARVDKARASARTFSDRVMYAFVLQDVGATQDAKDAWTALARERPDLPELAALAR